MTTTSETLHAFIQAFLHKDPYTTGELLLKCIKKKRIIQRLKTPSYKHLRSIIISKHKVIIIYSE